MEWQMKQNKNANAFENVKAQIGYCGIWCGSCIVGNGTLREMTEKYKDLIDAYSLKDWGPKDIDFAQFYKGLESIQNMDLCEGCCKGGGRDNCEIRSCAKEKELDNCTFCEEFEQCKNAEILKRMRSGALAARLYVLSKGEDKREFIKQKYAELKSRWPCCILFMNDRA
jgi:hypothetical protein